ncbi:MULTISPECIES: hypothetical protein [unclassified Actinotalea]|uniref:hypothetical protein n=1 Tax=unclassified Actinotalea TaxID=2638618 RepID=UPI0015F3CC68|nr:MULTISPECIES: hypothetical protein [unclassified Actinotalea]
MAGSATQIIEVALPPEQAEAAVYQAFVQAGLEGVAGGGGIMNGTVGVSWASWGEKIRATIGHGTHGSVVHLHSESALPTTLIDFGKNKKNLAKVVAAIRDHAPVV